MKYFVSLFMISLFVTHSVQAQNKHTSSSVYLKDGSVYIGEIIKEDIFEIVMKTKALDTITINKALVKNTVRAKEIIHVENGKYHKTEGLFGGIELAYSFGNAHYSQSSAYLGKRITPRLALGGGIGLTTARLNGNVNGLWIQHDFFQVFSYGRYYLNDKKVRLFGDMKLGWGFSLVDDWAGHTDQGGFYANPGIGIEFANRKKVKWSIKLSQNLQKVSTQQQWGDQLNPINVDLKQIYNRTALSIGINF